MLLAIGLTAGLLGGLFGVGGGLVLVPALILILKMKELEAFGTSLAALVPPSGLLGAIEYYRHGSANVKFAVILAVGLLVGIYFGARFAISFPPGVVRRLYGGFLLLVAIRFLAGR